MNLVLCPVTLPKKDELVLEGLEFLRKAKQGYASKACFLSSKQKWGQGLERQRHEGEWLLAQSQGMQRWYLDAEGAQYSSLSLQKEMQKSLHRGPIAFLIGGPDGHHESQKTHADKILSLSRMTMPHRMAFLFIAEQIYRAYELDRGGPYAK